MNGHVTAHDLAKELGAKRSGSGWMAKCPTHKDRLPSLAIHTGKKGTILNCHAGCRVKDICLDLGISMPQLFADYTEGGSHNTELDMLLREVIRKKQGPDLRPNILKLGEVMDMAFSGTVEDACRAHVYAHSYLEYEFMEAWGMWHITADLAVWPYMERYVKESGRSWHAVKREAMDKLYETWKQEIASE